MMNKIIDTVFPIIWLGGLLFLMGYYTWKHQFDLLFITIITSLNSLTLGSLLTNLKKK